MAQEQPYENCVWLTKAQITKKYQATKAEINTLIKLGYLVQHQLGPRMKRLLASEVEVGIKAFLANEKPPTHSTRARSHISWEA
jgi:hypothetical protein